MGCISALGALCLSPHMFSNPGCCLFEMHAGGSSLVSTRRHMWSLILQLMMPLYKSFCLHLLVVVLELTSMHVM